MNYILLLLLILQVHLVLLLPLQIYLPLRKLLEVLIVLIVIATFLPATCYQHCLRVSVIAKIVYIEAKQIFKYDWCTLH